jgi:2-keto-4-pentenoate hydratase/2-oxohepta-3-ene-1,7-dioic acid hydratase in catechol pathway
VRKIQQTSTALHAAKEIAKTMKLVCYTHRNAHGVGVLDLDGGAILPVVGPDGAPLAPQDMAAIVASTMPPAGRQALRTSADLLPLSQVTLLAPLSHPPKNVFCVGRNYLEHSDEFDRSGYDAASTSGTGASPEAPIVFTKPRTAIIGPESEVNPHVGLTQALDYEAELAVIIGRTGFGIPRAQAWDYIWGMTLVNDITARDLQRQHKQWFLGKCLDTFLPMGPYAVTMDELEGQDIVLEGRVNGELRQRASIKEMIFDIPTIIETLSAGMTLEPGDVIATGTPAGVGIGFAPPRFLRPGDELEVSATGLGALRNRIAGQADHS